MTDAHPIRIGLVGAGAISTQHLEAIAALDGLELAGVVSSSEERARAVGEAHGVPWSTRLEDLLDRPDVDAVTIATPSGLHPSQALAALRSGKHVIVEKPIALSVADAQAVVTTGRKRGLVVATISQRRFESAVRTLKAAVDANALGRRSLIIAEGLYHRPQAYYDSAPWRGTRELDGGVLMNQAIHMVDLVRWIGGSVRSVAAHVATLGHTMEAEDTAAVSLRFADGALGTIVATTCASPEFPAELRVYGDRGHVRLVGDDAVEWDVPGMAVPTPDVIDVRPETSGTQTWGTNAQGYLRQYGDFVDAVRTGRPPLVTGDDGRDAVEIITAAYAADRTGRAVELGEARR
ncbi:MAG TPA: Gfo/Idh/MocA family oxidoreductase [Candidatus Limnocylindrales bacterium]|jgi:predicted dehydrogenase|nr:Gfo/Idh/MocA family oxidoreductase [Candidatus Limnocylindrales bacterium]